MKEERNYMRTIIVATLALFVLAILSSCSKKEEELPQPQPVVEQPQPSTQADYPNNIKGLWEASHRLYADYAFLQQAGMENSMPGDVVGNSTVSGHIYPSNDYKGSFGDTLTSGYQSNLPQYYIIQGDRLKLGQVYNSSNVNTNNMSTQDWSNIPGEKIIILEKNCQKEY